MGGGRGDEARRHQAVRPRPPALRRRVGGGAEGGRYGDGPARLGRARDGEEPVHPPSYRVLHGRSGAGRRARRVVPRHRRRHEDPLRRGPQRERGAPVAPAAQHGGARPIAGGRGRGLHIPLPPGSRGRHRGDEAAHVLALPRTGGSHGQDGLPAHEDDSPLGDGRGRHRPAKAGRGRRQHRAHDPGYLDDGPHRRTGPARERRGQRARHDRRLRPPSGLPAGDAGGGRHRGAAVCGGRRSSLPGDRAPAWARAGRTSWGTASSRGRGSAAAKRAARRTSSPRLDLGLVALSGHDICDWSLASFHKTLGERCRTLRVGEEIVIA